MSSVDAIAPIDQNADHRTRTFKPQGAAASSHEFADVFSLSRVLVNEDEVLDFLKEKLPESE